MELHDLSRRSLLQALAATLGAAALPAGWTDVLAAAQNPHVHAAAAASATAGVAKMTFFSAADAADVEAVAAQIIPTDDTPGAREAGAIVFIDHALGSFLSQLGSDYRSRLTEFHTAFRAAHPGTATFASLPSDQQIAFLKTVDRTPFFDMTRLLTVFGMFMAPSYGGNRDGIGWKLLGFVDQHSFYPPFGYYDRDYPGFVADTASKTAGTTTGRNE